MSLSWTTVKKPIIALSPMADHTDSAFCRIVKHLSPATIVFHEMVSAEAVVRGNEKTWGMAEIHPSERPLVQQIFGGEPEIMAQAAKMIVEKFQPEAIDINMGCPARKLTNNFNGAALMREPERAAAIVQAVKAAIKVPVSVKMRLGWNDPTECLTFAPIIEKAGADLISLHGRTKKQEYSGRADWTMIKRVKELVSIPVLGNGDVVSVEDAKRVLETGVDGILIGRGALGNPWIFRDIEKTLAGQEIKKITSAERAEIILLHAQYFLEQNPGKNLTNFRKHLVWYFKGAEGASKIRQSISGLKTLDELKIILSKFE
ncbi:MAG: tRNA dihydrouridine synthase DusB [Candidatus Uhrbacteria bacterium]